MNTSSSKTNNGNVAKEKGEKLHKCTQCDYATAASLAAVHAGAAAIKLRVSPLVISKLTSKVNVPAGFPLGPWPTAEHAKIERHTWRS